MREVTCIVCPKGCRLKVDEENDWAVTGNGCPRGAVYGKTECTAPTRVVTSTVCIQGGTHRRIPVKTSAPIPKEKVFQAMALLDDVCLQAPVKAHEPVVRNVLGTGVDFITTRSMEKQKQ
ncbi:DUF1667 domain-containing protein [uncultured Ruthenibacterium sp.]|uniref:DUF1667 domain-containing protein n=1 Tax=uncultured Ruthenibacterium sp. TaxID=1905347 RepID=UPI00349E70AC